MVNLKTFGFIALASCPFVNIRGKKILLTLVLHFDLYLLQSSDFVS